MKKLSTITWLSIILIYPMKLLAIVGGEPAADGDWSHTVSLYLLDTSQLDDNGTGTSTYTYCVGSLVAPSYVLTSASCVANRQHYNITARFGKNDSSIDFTDIEVTDLIIHENYDAETKDSDIALLRLASPSSMPIVQVMSAEVMNQLGSEAKGTFLGWGSTNPDGWSHMLTANLQQVELPIVSNTACSDAFSQINTNMICAGSIEGFGAGPCFGDQGSPLMIEQEGVWSQAGIQSFSYCGSGAPSVATRTAVFSDWITMRTSGVDIIPGIHKGFLNLGYQSKQVFELTNNTGSVLTVSAVELSGENTSTFQLIKDDCSEQAITLGQTCEIEISYATETAGETRVRATFLTDNLEVPVITSEVIMDVLESADTSTVEALDTDGVQWFVGGHKPWEVQSDYTTNGANGLQSGEIGDSQVSVLLALVNGAGLFSIDYRTSTEAEYDFLQVFLNDELIEEFSGESGGFSTLQVDTPAGSNRIEILYYKDMLVSSGEDKVFVDNAKFKVGSGELSGDDSSGGGGSIFLLLIIATIYRCRKALHSNLNTRDFMAMG